MNRPSSDAESINDYASNIRSHLSNKPNESSEAIEKALDQKLQKAEDEIPKAERVAAIESAKIALESKKDFELAARRLAPYSDEVSTNLLKQLNEIARANIFAQEINLAEKDINQSEKIIDPILKEYAIVRTNQAIMDMRLRLLSSGISDPKINEKISELEKMTSGSLKRVSDARQLRDTERMKKYQVDALKLIKNVLPLEKYIELEKFNRGEKVLTSIDAKQKAKEDLMKVMIHFMAPINQGLLDEAVGQWYRKVYQKRFDELDEAEQLLVMEGFATAKKMPLDALP